MASYMNNILILADNTFQIHYTILKISDLFERLGFTIKFQVSVLDPSSIITYLGITLNSKSKTMTLSTKNKTYLQS